MFQTLEELAAQLKKEGYDTYIKTTTYESFHPGDLNLIIEVALCDQTISQKPSEELTRVSMINAPNIPGDIVFNGFGVVELVGAPNIPEEFKEDRYDRAMKILNNAKQE